MVRITNRSGTFSGAKFSEKVDEFLGIQYARAERLQAPIDIEKYSGVVEAKTFGPQSPQVPGFMEEILNTKDIPVSEDCLYLNIWKPSVVNEPLPVLFWIHGGAYTNGTAATSWYHGANLVELGEVIVVSINYRLGPFGFIGENNLGLLDQISALRWVKRNIESFGGDPANVTIFGESAGGSSVVALTASPLTKGLITKAWAMSPSLLQLRSRAEADEAMSIFFDAAHIDSVNDLKSLTTQQIIDATAQMFLNVENYISAFSPTRGGSGLPEIVYEASAQSNLPLVVGTNRDENRLWTALNPQPLEEAHARELFEKAFAISAGEAWSTYGQLTQNASPSEMVSAMQTDQHFRVPAWQLCDTRNKLSAQTWMYWFTWSTPVFNGVLGCCHALDLPFMFSNLDKPNVDLFTGTSPVRSKISGHFTSELLQFAKTGKVSWPTYEAAERSTFRIDEDVEVLTLPDPAIRKLWNLSS
ncbi:MAG: carboxylesterase/lipase family protein [Acidimicrobiaceae bacterium]